MPKRSDYRKEMITPHSSSTFVFHGPNGEVIFNDTDGESLLAFIDDTGHEEFVDPDCPVFGLGGCAVASSDYRLLIRQPWIALKQKYCEGVATLLHGSDFANTFPQAVIPMAALFRSGQFFRFAVTVTPQSRLSPTEILSYGPGKMAPVYEQTTLVLKMRFKEVIAQCSRPIRRVVIVQEASERSDSLAERYFGRFQVAPPFQDLPIHLFRGTKSLAEPGLEMADFIVHTAGAQARRKRTGRGWGKDFEATFRDPPSRLVSYLDVDSVEC